MDTRWANMAALFAAGFLCIGHCLDEERASKPADFDTDMPSVNPMHILLPKLHLMRCYIRPTELQHTRKTHRKAKRCRVTINQNLDRVIRECQEFHVARRGVCWLYGNYVAALSGGQAPGPVRSLSVEIWQDQELVAGELGILLGRLYISLTGFYRKAGCGNVQLVALSRLLHKAGVEHWDLGMGMDYKANLGSRLIPRAEHISLTRSHRHFNETNARVTELESMSESSCESVMEWLPRISPSETNEL